MSKHSGTRSTVRPRRSSDEPRTVRDLAERWDDLIPRSDPETARHNRQMVESFVAAHGGKPLDAVTVFMARQFAVRHPSSVRYAKTFFADAVRLGLLEESPFAEVQAPQQEGRASNVPPTYAQVLAAARYAEPNFADFLLTAAFTGARLMELARVEARDVESDRRLRLRHGKGRNGPRPRTVTMFEHAQSTVWRRKPEVGLVFTDVGGRRWDRRKVSRCWGAVRGAASIEDSFRCLRNFHGTWLIDRGASPLDVAVQLGHIDKNGRPYTALVERLYTRPDHGEALGRLEALA
jgi:integrase